MTACHNSLDCVSVSADLVCDPRRGFCVQCAKGADCKDDQQCVTNQCVVVTNCQSSDDCKDGKVCDTGNGSCVECLSDDKCTSSQHCIQNTCRTACASDRECTPQGMLCGTTVCIECSAQKACATGSYCNSTGLCKTAVCTSGESMCSDTGVAQCKADGSGWGSVVACSDSKPCEAYGGVATCGGSSPTPDGGVITPNDGGTTPGDGPIPTCGTDMAMGTATPCTTIPKLYGTQTVDGKDDDFCGVPSFQFTYQNPSTVKLNNYNNIPMSQFEVVTARVAWSSAGFSAFFDVQDSSIQTVYDKDQAQAISRSYQGDSIELFISSSNTVSGLTGTDSNTLHVILPADGPAVSVKTSNSGGASTGTPTALPTTQYNQAKTSTGYAIEVQLPWPGGAAPSSGTQIRFDLALNSADTTCSGVDDMRDAQMVYYVGTVTNTTCQSSNDGTVPYCDDRTWCTTTLE